MLRFLQAFSVSVAFGQAQRHAASGLALKVDAAHHTAVISCKEMTGYMTQRRCHCAFPMHRNLRTLNRVLKIVTVQIGNEEVHVTVVVVVRCHHSFALGNAIDSRLVGNIFERTVAAIAEQLRRTVFVKEEYSPHAPSSSATL